MEQEGVIKFRLDFRESDGEPGQHVLAEMNRVRAVLIEQGMLGQSSDRYDGYGFGNISFRDGETTRFWISGSQTGHLDRLSLKDMACVSTCDAQGNFIEAHGRAKPSSESMTHGVLYQLDSRINAVIHVHCPAIWNDVSLLGINATSKDLVYGTPEMAEAVTTLSKELLNAGGLPLVFAMMGHEDGVVAAGSTLDDCLALLCSLNLQSIKASVNTSIS